MRLTQTGGADGRMLRRYEYEDEWVVAAELGAAGDAGDGDGDGDVDVDVDVVGGTAIVIVDGKTEAEIELPGEAATIAAGNGVLTIRGEA